MDCSGIIGTGLLGCPEPAPVVGELDAAVFFDDPGMSTEIIEDAAADDCPIAGLVGDDPTDVPVAPATGQMVVYSAMVDVTTVVDFAGQLVTVDGQAIIVDVMVV